MVSVFRKNDVINFFLLLPYTIVLRAYSLIYPSAYQIEQSDTVLAKGLFTLFDNPFLQGLIGIILVFIQALIINVLANKYRLHRRPTALAGMVYVILVSFLPSFQILTPSLIASTFILFATYSVFSTYKLNNAVKNILNSSLACAIATLIYAPFVITILPLFVGLAMLRNFRMQERLQFLVGFLTMFWVAAAFLFFFDLLDWNIITQLQLPGVVSNFRQLSMEEIWPLSIFVLMVLLSLLNYYNYKKKKVIEIRKKIDFFYWLLLSAIIPLLFFPVITQQYYLFTSLSFSIFLSMSILLIKNKTLAEMIHLVAISGIFYYQYVT